MGIPRIRRTDISIGDDGNGNSGIQEGFHRSRCHSDQSRERLSSKLQTPRLYRVHSFCTTSIFRLKKSPGIVLLCAVQYRGFPMIFSFMLLPPFTVAVAAYRSQRALLTFCS
jgi:hypothetical protein